MYMYYNIQVGPDKHNFQVFELVYHLLPISLNVRFGYSKNRLIETVILSTQKMYLFGK